MTLTIANTYDSLQNINYRARSPIRATDWKALAQQQHLLFDRLVAEWGGHTWSSGTPYQTTNDSSLTQVNANSSRDLNFLNISGTMDREIEGANVRFGFSAYGESGDITVKFTNVDTGSDASLTVTMGSGLSWHSTTQTASRSNVVDGNGDPQLIKAEVFAQAASSSTLTLEQIRVGEAELTGTSDLPDGL